MGFITDLENRLEVVKQNTSIQSVVNDDITQINANAKNAYPMLLFRATGDTNPDTNKKNQQPIYNIEFFLADYYPQGDTNTIGQKQDEVINLLSKVILSIPDSSNDFVVIGQSTAQFARDAHNDRVVIVQRNVTIRGFNCVTKV